MKMKKMIMPVLLVMLAAVCMPVQAEGKNTAKTETVTVDVNQSGAGKSVTLNNTKGKNAKDVKALKEIIAQQDNKNEDNTISTDLNSDQYKWKKGRLVEIHWGSEEKRDKNDNIIKSWNAVGLKGNISFAGLTQLKKLNCSCNALSKLNVSKNTKLETLGCGCNKLSKLDVSKNKKLEILQCYGNKLSKLDVSKNTKLEKLYCANNKLSKLDVSKNKKLEYLGCADNKLSKLNVSKNTKLEILDCSYNKLSKLDVSKNRKLETLDCRSNKLKKLDLGKNKKLKSLYCEVNKLTKLDLSKNKKLSTLICDKNVKVKGYKGTVRHTDMDIVN